MRVLKFLVDNLASILLAFVLSVTVWVSAVIAQDPNEARLLPRNLSLELVGLDEELVVVGELPEFISVSLRAPVSVWEEINQDQDSVKARVNVFDLTAGAYELPVEIEVSESPVQITVVDPQTINLVLEPLVAVEGTVRPLITGVPALGFQRSVLDLSQRDVLISGPESVVMKVADVRAELDVTEARETVQQNVTLYAYDENDQRLSGLTLEPAQIQVTQDIVQSGGYRDVAVKVETTGQVAGGYRVTNISVLPVTVTLFSNDPQLVAEMPGFVRTQPLDLSEANANIETRLVLDLPEGITLVGDEQTVEVEISIAAIETSLSIQVPISVIGLGSELAATISPEEVDLILSGPVPVLEALRPENVVIVVNLAELEAGTHLVVPESVTLPEDVVLDSIIPETIEVNIGDAEAVNAETASATP